MTTVTIEEAQAKLAELIADVAAGGEVIITQHEQPVARLLAGDRPHRKPRKAGNCKGILSIVADDDGHLDDFAEHMG